MQTLKTDQTVWSHWLRNAEQWPEHEAIVHWKAGEEPVRWSWANLVTMAKRTATWLSANGVRSGEVCAIIFRHNPDFYPLYFGISALGALPAVLAYPNARLHPDKFRKGLQGMAERSGLDWIVTEPELAPTLCSLVVEHNSTIRGVLCPFGIEDMPVQDGLSFHYNRLADQPCLLQHSSGTTGLQKAVVLSHRAIIEHIGRYADAISAADGDKVVSWLPLYHDMGLIAAFYLPLTLGIPLVQLDPFEWVTAPVIFLQAASAEHATIGWLPNFAYNLMADRVNDEDLDGVRLDHMRLLVNCSEPIRAQSHDRFARRYSKYGLKRQILSSCYAMAETTFAVTQSKPGEEARRLEADRAALSSGRVVLTEEGKGRSLVSSGCPVQGCEIKIIRDEEEVGEDLVGELMIRSVALFDGYRNNAEKTAAVLIDGWYLSGDYGFKHDGEYYIIGRKKDLIIVAGKNIYPEDIEDAVGQVAGVIPGRVVAFGIDDEEAGTEQIAVVAETNLSDADSLKLLRRKVVEAGMALDLTIARVYFAPPRWLIKSSSGKLSRSDNRNRALTELTYNGAGK
jgi:acyl-CoA synthetase (AMP-forming)/AMP-acid ligase II